jgi:hypothetical protein
MAQSGWRLAKSTKHFVSVKANLAQPYRARLSAACRSQNEMLNGETIRLDGAIRMAPR